jgi:hypothetical protein
MVANFAAAYSKLRGGLQIRVLEAETKKSLSKPLSNEKKGITKIG